MTGSGWEGSGSELMRTGELLGKRSASLSGSPDGPGQFLGAQNSLSSSGTKFRMRKFRIGCSICAKRECRERRARVPMPRKCRNPGRRSVKRWAKGRSLYRMVGGSMKFRVGRGKSVKRNDKERGPITSSRISRQVGRVADFCPVARRR